jgi:hypothetical protein
VGYRHFGVCNNEIGSSMKDNMKTKKAKLWMLWGIFLEI